MNILTTPSSLVMNDPVLFMRHVKKQSQMLLLASVVVLLIGLALVNRIDNEQKNIIFIIMIGLWVFSIMQWILSARSIEQQSNQCLLALLKIQNSKDNQLGDYQVNLDNLRNDLAMAQQKSNTLQNNFIAAQATNQARVM